jgi:hypothetical protein
MIPGPVFFWPQGVDERFEKLFDSSMSGRLRGGE